MAAVAQSGRRVLIPLKSSAEDPETLKSTRRFAIDVWNVTARWTELAAAAATRLEAFASARQRVLDADGASSAADKERTMGGAVRDHDALCDLLEDLSRQIDKLKTAQSRTTPMRKLASPSVSSSPSPSTPSTPPSATATLRSTPRIAGSPAGYSPARPGSARSVYVLGELERLLPRLIKMYEQELASKRQLFESIGRTRSRRIANAAIVSFRIEPFVEPCLVNELYALIVEDQREVIEIAVEELPDLDEILNILRDEHARLNVWISVAVEYYKLKRYDVFTRILELSGQEANLDYPGYERDQVRALDTLAAFYVKQGHRERGPAKEKRKENYTKATLLYTTADKILMYDPQHLLGRAYFCMLEGNKIDQADQQFTFVLQGATESCNIPALLGKACISFQKKDYNQALFSYKKALRMKPDCPADVRVGLGHCYAKLGKMDLARRAFERALQIDKTNIPAMCAVAIMDLNLQTEESVTNAIRAFSAAYTREQDNPVVLNHLANHFFYRGDLGKVENLARHAFQITDTEPIRAESCYHMARCLHRQGNYSKAFQYYYQATQFASPSFILPFYGLGQMYIQRKEYANAINCFEKILAVHPTNVETLKILGSLYAHAEEDPKKGADNRIKSRQHLAKYLELVPDDIEVLIDMAQLVEQSDPTKSMQYYEKVVELLAKEDMEPPMEIINNMGSLAMAQGDYERARDLYQKAIDRLEEEVNDDVEAFRITIMWNQARAAELLCMFETAEKLYKDVLRKDPQYIDSFIRLGCIARDRGQIYESSVFFKECMAVNQSHADAWTLIGNLHMSKHEWLPAQKKFEHILKMPQYKDDAYSLVALGNIWLETLFSINRNKDKDKIHQDRALLMFTRALKVQPKNMWAANGIGCVLAVRGHMQEAREIFSQVREATADFLDVWINIAHVYMEQRQYVAAVQMYLNAMKKFAHENDPVYLMYLARAYYRTGKLTECRETLEKASIEQPDNLLIKFNHAYVLQKQATQTMKDEKAAYEVVEGAVSDLKTAERIFRYIDSLKDEARSAGISCRFTEQQANACADLLKQAQVYLQRARQQDEEERALKAKQEEERNAIMKKLAEEEEEKAESRRQQMEDLKQTRQLYIQMTKDILKLPEIKEDERKSRGGGGGRGRKSRGGEEFVNDSSDMGDWEGAGGEGGGGERRKKEGKSRKRRKDRGGEGEGSGSDGGGGGGGDRKRKKKYRAASPKLSAKQSAKIKSRAFISDDDDSDEDGNTSLPQATQIVSTGDSPPRPPASSSGSSSPTDSEEDARPRKTKGGRKKAAAPPTDSEESEKADSDESDAKPKRSKGRKKVAAPPSESEEEEEERGGSGSGGDEGAGGGGGGDSEEDSPTKRAPRRISSSEDSE